ncbi:MAG: hypothetical protein H7144_10940, partial [Burkholderiales bacterium]|nr:hypothetical protein [Phycisphaerae bacterium]
DRSDRRIYRVSLTRDGARLLKNLSMLTRELHRRQFTTINRRHVTTLARLLGDVNEAPIPGRRGERNGGRDGSRDAGRDSGRDAGRDTGRD